MTIDVRSSSGHFDGERVRTFFPFLTRAQLLLRWPRNVTQLEFLLSTAAIMSYYAVKVIEGYRFSVSFPISE